MYSLTKLADSTPWAILPDKLEQIYAVIEQHAAAGQSLKITPDSTEPQLVGNTAVIPVYGTLLKRSGGLAALSGIRSMQKMRSDVQEALDNPDVSAIVLDIDSPGGTVDGTKDFADFISAADKPVVSYVNGMAASAAYWIAAQSDTIILGETAQAGSIGVVMQHVDRSKAIEDAGEVHTLLYRGKYKTVGNSIEPLSDEAKNHIQSKIDTLYQLFVDAVAEARNLEVSMLVEKVATGETFIGKEAITVGLADQLGSLEDAIKLAQQKGDSRMSDKAQATQLEELQAQFAAMQEQFQAAEKDKAAIEAQNAELAEKLQAKETAEAQAKRLSEVTAKFDGMKVEESTVAAFASLNDATLELVASEIGARQKKIDAHLAELGETTPDATTADDHASAPQSIDEAISMIESRDDVDIDVAETTAMSEFPELFKV